jgi:outer membrane receptor protein involved in Fe transport
MRVSTIWPLLAALAVCQFAAGQTLAPDARGASFQLAERGASVEPATATSPPDAPSAPTSPSSPNPPAVNPRKVDDLLNLDLDQLSKVSVRSTVQPANVNAPATQINTGDVDTRDATTTGELARQAPSVSTRRTSAVNLDPRVRGYHSGQLNATANGMNELKTRLDIDSALSQIDPGIVQDITVIDGPYTSLYGPGFAFLAVDLSPPPRFAATEAHAETLFLYGTNGQTLYTRENLLAGGKDWGTRFSYGLRDGNDYKIGGRDPYRIPSSYQKWDALFSTSVDLSPGTRLEFDYIRCEMNDVELPGVVYDIDNSTNNQFNVRYVVQDDPKGPRQFVAQAWHQGTGYHGDALRSGKQQTLYHQFFTLPASTDGEWPVNTVGQGRSDSTGARFTRTFGDRDAPQWTIGADWRRYQQRYQETNLDVFGDIVLGGGDIYGIPRSHMDDFGLLTDLLLPFSDRVSFNVGGRLDYCTAWLDQQDPVIVAGDPAEWYYAPGFTEPSKLLGMAYLTNKIKLTESCTLNAGAAYAMRMPDLAELYSDDPFVPIARFGNSYVSGLSTLSPEKDLQFDLGVSMVKERFSCGVRGFYALVWDYILPVPGFIDPSAPYADATHALGRNFRDFPPEWRTDLVPNPDGTFSPTPSTNADTNQAGYQYANVDLVTLAGGDLFAEMRLLDWLSLYGNMAYVRGTNWRPIQYVAADTWLAKDGRFMRVGGPEGVPNIYPFNGLLSVRVFQPKQQRWLVEFSSRMVAHQRHVAESLSELPTPGFAVFGLRGHYQASKNLRLTLAVENLFNKRYTEPGSLVILNPQGVPVFVQEPGLTCLLGVDARF